VIVIEGAVSRGKEGAVSLIKEGAVSRGKEGAASRAAASEVRLSLGGRKMSVQ